MKARAALKLLPPLIILVGCTGSQPPPEETPFLTAVAKYADTMVSHGRDVYGEPSPLFASTMNRQTLKIDPTIDTVKIDGVRTTDRSVTGGNLLHDVDLYELLYGLSALTDDPRYAAAADSAFGFFFNTCQSETTDLYCWGEHLFWDFQQDDCGYAPKTDYHESNVWPFWDKAYNVAPERAWKYTLAEWEHQIHDKTTGDFSRHARYTRHETFSGYDFPRYAGQLMERWTFAYKHPANADRPRREELRQYIQVMFERMKENMAQSASGLLIAGRTSKGDHNQVVWLTSNLELARCLEIAATVMQPAMAAEMRVFALKQDQDFLKAPHRMDSIGGGFAVTLHAETGLPRVRSMNKPYSSTWSSGYGYGTHAGVANRLYARYRTLQVTSPEVAEAFKEMILKAGRIYLSSEPDTSYLLKPNEFAQVIQMLRNCWELSGDIQFLDRAAQFAEIGMSLFFDDASALPKATNQHDHYESITGGPSFMLQLLRLHEARQ